MSWPARTAMGGAIGTVVLSCATWFAAPNHDAGTLALGAGIGLVIGAFVGLTQWYR